MKIVLRKERGVTLIALIVSVIVLLILAGVSISVAVGDHDKDIISKTFEAKEMAEESQKESEEFLERLENEEDTTVVDDGKHKVSFYNDTTLLATIRVENGETVTYPSTATTPIRENGTFSGKWSLDSEGTQEADLSSVTSDMIVYAMFNTTETVQYQVTFKDYDGTTLAQVNVSPGGTVVYPNSTPLRDNYIFSKWATTSGGSTTASLTNITADKTVYAYYLKIYKVTFSYKDSNGATITSVAEVASGGSVASSNIPSPATYTSGSTKYTFSKWVTTSGGSTTASLTNITTDKTVYAYYTSSSTSSTGHYGGGVI